MATHKIGKLKFRLQDGGVDLRWGDGEIRRLGLKRKTENQEYDDQYIEDYDMNKAEDMDSEGRFYDEESGYEEYPEDDYADGAYDDGYDDGYDEEYPEEEYEDDGYGEYAGEYDPEYDDYGEEAYDDYDDGYSDGYEDDYEDGYEDGYGEYDEYSDEYADGYADEYAEYPEGWLGGLIQYVDENDWVTYLLLFLLPPLGIYLLWRRQRFDRTMRYALSAASAVWFIVLIVLLFTVVFSGRGDVVYHGGVTLPPSAEPTMAVEPEVTVEPGDFDVEVTPEAVVQPSPTPIGGGAAQTTGNLVWCSASGSLYHKTNTCEQIAQGESVTQVTLENAQSRNKYACPACHGEEVYYATAGGQYYHLDEHCSDMKNAVVYSKEQAVATGKSACPVCVSKTQQQLNAAGNDVKIISSSTTDKSGIRVWATAGGKYYHITSNCSGMKGAVEGSLKDALLLGKAACPTCCKASGALVYCTEGGTYYHAKDNCSGMVRAKHVTLAEALVLGKKQCNVCISTVSAGTQETSAEYYVYGTPTGKYYHINSTCSGMTGAQKVLLSYMLKINREACPECCSGAEMTVYAAPGGSYYHSYATCSGMQNAVQGTLAQAMAMGYQRCTRCWGGSNSGEAGSDTGAAGSSSALVDKSADDIMVYATKTGTYYHTKNNCSGMTGASHITLEVAMKAGKKACPTCSSAALIGVYSTQNGKYYHKVSDCSGMRNATKRTLADALLLGQTACPTCLTTHVEDGDNAPQEEVIDSDSVLKKVANFKSGTSGIKVYALQTGSVFHTKSTCSGMKNASHITLETALNYGFEPCKTCCASAAKTVYATKNGKYYHVSKSCAGNGAISGSLAQALAYGYTSCPYCVTSSNTNNNVQPSGDEFKVGTSGVKVYSTVDGEYYHANKSCAGSGAVQVSLETALNYGKVTCPKCASFADRTVYAVPGKSYYHANRSCAGSDAVAGTYAYALSFGLKACPKCIGGSSSGGAGNVTAGAEYSAPAGTKVYVDLYSDEYYYHKSSKCSGSGMTSSTGVTLEFVKDLGYKRCPYCNPASGIE